MFERIKCYRTMNKIDKMLYSIRALASLSCDEAAEMVKIANETLDKHRMIRKKMWFDRSIAKEYNLEFAKNGFSWERES